MRFPWKIVGGCAGMLLVLGVSNYGRSAWDAARRVERIKTKLEQVRKLGWATHPSEVPRRPAVGRNAYDDIKLLTQPSARTSGAGFPSAKLDLFFGKTDDQLLRSIMAKHQRAILSMSEAFRATNRFELPRQNSHEFSSEMLAGGVPRSVSQWILAMAALDARDGKLEASKEKIGWHHRMNQALFDTPQLVNWMIASNLMSIERGVLMGLLQEGLPVESLLDYSATSGLRMQLDPRLVEQDELLLLISIPTSGDEPAAQREPWEIKVREFLRLKNGPGVPMEVREAPGYIPKFPKMQRVMERLLDEWIVIGPKRAAWDGAFERSEAISLISDHVWGQIPAIAGDDFEFSTPLSRHQRARLLEKPLVQASMFGEFLRAWKLRKKLGRWPSESEFRLTVVSKYPSATYRFFTDMNGFIIESDTIPGASDPAVSFRYPPKRLGATSGRLTELRQSSLELLGMLPGKAPKVLGGPPSYP